jgi:CelD/BcsL family acetyltransferase involved in cellulose biosynthesis
MAVAVHDAWALESWRGILGRIPDPHPFVAPEWQRAWWEHFGVGELEVLELGGAGVAALQRTGATLRFLGSRDVTDYPGPAIAPGREREAAERLLARLRAGDRLEVDDARPEDAFPTSLEAAARAAGMRVQRAPDEAIAVLALPDSWDAYLRSVTRHTRHEIERKRRRAASTTTRTGTIADLDAFFALMRRARGAKATFLTAPIERFLHQIARTHETLRLDVLEREGRPLAMTVGFQGPATYYLYNMGYDPAAAHLSPGIVLVAALIERAIAEQRERFDFMRGLEHYKLQLGARASSLIRLRLERA